MKINSSGHKEVALASSGLGQSQLCAKCVQSLREVVPKEKAGLLLYGNLSCSRGDPVKNWDCEGSQWGQQKQVPPAGQTEDSLRWLFGLSWESGQMEGLCAFTLFMSRGLGSPLPLKIAFNDCMHVQLRKPGRYPINPLSNFNDLTMTRVGSVIALVRPQELQKGHTSHSI